MFETCLKYKEVISPGWTNLRDLAVRMRNTLMQLSKNTLLMLLELIQRHPDAIESDMLKCIIVAILVNPTHYIKRISAK
jgi:hypothetical protein